MSSSPRPTREWPCWTGSGHGWPSCWRSVPIHPFGRAWTARTRASATRCGGAGRVRGRRSRLVPLRPRETVERMVGTGTLLDTGMVYFNARLSERYPTIEVRISDVCLRADDTVLIAALVRALVETEARSWRDGRPVERPRTELL